MAPRSSIGAARQKLRSALNAIQAEIRDHSNDDDWLGEAEECVIIAVNSLDKYLRAFPKAQHA